MEEERTNSLEAFDDEQDNELDDLLSYTPRPSCKECPRGKLHSFNWLADIPGNCADSQLVEVQFKNTRKGYYRNTTNLPLKIGDMVAVEASPGHDIGKVSMLGALVEKQMKRSNFKQGTEIRRVFRIAKPADLEKYRESCAKETDTMIRARKIAESLNLSMKIGDVEYQGDGNKAIFYYIADERVDFRQLIKVLAEVFRVRIEMRQIGARQEAGRIGGTGPCGRPLCCSSWMTNFVSVATSAARYQDISLNPQKLAGQCAKLKCCLNFEVDTYVESIKRLPPREVRLETTTGTFYHFKTDIFRREITYSSDKQIAANLVTISAARAFEVISMNKEGIKPDSLLPDGSENPRNKHNVHDILGEGDVTRFDKKKKKKPSKNKEQRTKNKEQEGTQEQRTKNKEQEGTQEQRTKNKEQEPGQEQRTKNKEQEAGQEQRTKNKEQEAGQEQRTKNKEQEAGQEQRTKNKEQEANANEPRHKNRRPGNKEGRGKGQAEQRNAADKPQVPKPQHDKQPNSKPQNDRVQNDRVQNDRQQNDRQQNDRQQTDRQQTDRQQNDRQQPPKQQSPKPQPPKQAEQGE